MGKKKKQKYDEMYCFCIGQPDVDAVLDKVLAEQRYVLAIDRVDDDESLVRLVHWKRDAPPIKIDDVEGNLAKLRIETALEDLEDVVKANPYAWYAQGSQHEIRELRDRLKRSTMLVRFRHPDVGMGWRGPFRVCRSLAGKIRFQVAGVVKLADYVFETRAGQVIR